MRRRDFIKTVAGAAAGAMLARPALSQGAWPQKDKVIKIIVPWPPGAANDALGRLFAEQLQSKLGATTMVENRTGGAGLIGTRAVVQADPDGYTFLASAFNTAVMPRVLKAAADFNPETDLEVVARTATAPLVFVISASRPEKTLTEVIAAAKAQPQNWNFAISSLGSAGHLATIELLRRIGVNITLVPYRGTQPALQDIMGGAAQLLIDPSFALLPAAMDGTKVRAIGIATRERSVLAPEVPTLAEAGLPGFEFNSWYGLWAPRRTPPEIVARANAVIQETMREPAIVERLQKTLIVPVSEGIDATKAFIRSEIVRSGQLLDSVKFEPS
jgi:tripartite-type tricarboxylate transporter receptor subunit TctC